MTSEAAWWDVFAGVPWPVEILFFIVLVVALSSVASAIVLAVSAARARRVGDIAAGHRSSESDYLWVFLVAALNEEVTIADAVQRLCKAQARRSIILVINDGSDDRTGEILAEIDDPKLRILTRVPPQARMGKAVALNHAYRYLVDELLPQPAYSQWPHDRVIVGIIDADGRLDANAPQAIARRFSSERVGGVQCLVRIYNRNGFLTWAQDVEFSMFAKLFQAGRTTWGTANMGGNGQFNRLSALDDVAETGAPWRDRLTEDQDLGVRLIQHGWSGVQENSVGIDQQGLSSLRKLYRQRTRWAQGAWQAIGLARGARRARLGLLPTWDLVYYLMTPIIQLVTGAGLVAALIVNAFRQVSFIPQAIPVLVFFLALGFLPGVIALLHRGRGVRGVLVTIALSVPYLAYTWLLFPVVVRSLLRQVSGRTSWAKTEREPLEAEATSP